MEDVEAKRARNAQYMRDYRNRKRLQTEKKESLILKKFLRREQNVQGNINFVSNTCCKRMQMPDHLHHIPQKHLYRPTSSESGKP
jgi:hypothetical protein